jgi:hypothetical protein
MTRMSPPRGTVVDSTRRGSGLIARRNDASDSRCHEYPHVTEDPTSPVRDGTTLDAAWQCFNRLHPTRVSSRVPIELQPVAIGIAHVELPSTPRRVGDVSSVRQWPELVRQTVDVFHGETQRWSIACDPNEVMPLQRENGVVATDKNEHRGIRVIAELLNEPELGVEPRRRRDVADVEYGLDPFDC